MKICHLITRLIIGGAQENTLYTAALLDRKRFQVDLLSGPQTGSEGSLIEEIQSQKIPLTILPNLLREASPIQDLIALRKIAKFIRQGNYSIVHTHSSKAGILGRIAARIAGTPIIIHTIHGWSFHDYMHPLPRQVYIRLEKWAATFTDTLIAVTKSDIAKGLQSGIGATNKYRLVRSAIPLREFDPMKVDRRAVRGELSIPDDAIVIGNIGRFTVQKNPLDWIRIAGAISQSYPQVYFLLVGDGPLRPEVQSLACQLGISSRTIMTGIRRDVPRLLAAMDIFLITSLWEGLPRVIPQAMAMGLPVVANQVDGVAEAIQNGQFGFLCPPGDILSSQQFCQRLIENPEERLEIARRGQAFANQEFSLNHMIEQIEIIYQEQLTRKLPSIA